MCVCPGTCQHAIAGKQKQAEAAEDSEAWHKFEFSTCVGQGEGAGVGQVCASVSNTPVVHARSWSCFALVPLLRLRVCVCLPLKCQTDFCSCIFVLILARHRAGPAPPAQPPRQVGAWWHCNYNVVCGCSLQMSWSTCFGPAFKWVKTEYCHVPSGCREKCSAIISSSEQAGEDCEARWQSSSLGWQSKRF